MFLKTTTFIFIVIAILASRSHASLQVTFTPEVGMMEGYTEYEMDYYFKFLNYITGEPVPTVWRINSLLEFPLDTKIGGFSATLHPEIDQTRWSLYAKFLTSLTEPQEKMLDSDWEGITTIFPYAQFSYTESDANSNMHLYEVGFQYRIVDKENYDISMIFEAQYQQIFQEVTGYSGWYRPFDTSIIAYSDTTVAISGAEDTIVITYKLQKEHVALGLQSNLFISDKLTTQIHAAFTPILFNDTDDHTLRFKRSTSNGFGIGYKGGFNIRYELPFSKLSFVQLNTTFSSFTAEGSQAQIWYEHERGIDPETQRSIILVREGTAIASIPHEVRSKQYTINLLFGITF